MYLGVDYYPEHWNKDMMDSDIDRMLIMGVNTVRIGEFAWHIMEPKEGYFQFDFFDEVIAKLKTKKIKVIFGTPTATPPAWLVKKHPEVLLKDENLNRVSFGGRREYCFNSDIYRRYTKKIVTELVAHYKDEDNIVAWQVDNELGHESSDLCYCEECHKSFRSFLQNKYKSIEEVNKAWGTVFWNHTYNEFDEIPLPVKTITVHNPALQLDFQRFRSKSLKGYSDFQVGLIKEIVGDNQLVTTNLPGGFFEKSFDFEALQEKCDIAAYDNYPVWGGLKEPVPPHAIAFSHDFIRGLKDKNYWILEELMGAQGHTIIGYLPRPNQAKMWAYQAVAHGCEGLLFFRWRGATFGAEEFCYGILDQDNIEGRKYYEVQSFFEDIKKYDEILKSEIKAEVALVYDYDNAWAWRIQPQSTTFNYLNEAQRLYKPFYSLNTTIDVISEKHNFDKYKVLLLPVMMVTDEEIKIRLEEFVKRGGTIILSFRASIKDRNNNLYLGQTVPCGLSELAGIEIHEVESLQEDQLVPVQGRGNFEGKSTYGTVWRDIIDCKTAEALYVYSDKFYKNKACITVNNYGKGKVYYIGSGVGDDVLYDISKEIIGEKKIDFIETAEGIEIYTRTIKDTKCTFLINHTEEDQIALGNKLEPYQVKILS
ncbi:MAG: beta-galactosidase [Clostridiaceae bacterium]|nr:beta-galactosidase [Clostridiaceae bacterium]